MRFDIEGEAAGDVDMRSLSDGSSEAFLLRPDMLCRLNGGSGSSRHMLAMHTRGTEKMHEGQE